MRHPIGQILLPSTFAWWFHARSGRSSTSSHSSYTKGPMTRPRIGCHLNKWSSVCMWGLLRHTQDDVAFTRATLATSTMKVRKRKHIFFLSTFRRASAQTFLGPIEESCGFRKAEGVMFKLLAVYASHVLTIKIPPGARTAATIQYYFAAALLPSASTFVTILDLFYRRSNFHMLAGLDRDNMSLYKNMQKAINATAVCERINKKAQLPSHIVNRQLLSQPLPSDATKINGAYQDPKVLVVGRGDVLKHDNRRPPSAISTRHVSSPNLQPYNPPRPSSALFVARPCVECLVRDPMNEFTIGRRTLSRA